MKTLFLFILFAFIIVSCQKENTVVVSGKIANPTNEPTILRINYFDKTDTLILESDGTFSYETGLDDEHFAFFGHGRFAIPLYLVPGAKIFLEFDAKEVKGWIYSNALISGKKSETSSFLYALTEKLNNPVNEEIRKMELNKFSNIINELEKTTSNDIENFIKTNSPSDKFIKRIKLKQQVGLALKYSDFIRFHNSGKNQENPIPAYFQEYIDRVPLNDTDNVKEINEYQYFLYQYNRDKVDMKMKNTGLERETVAFINKLADEIIALNAPQEIKDDIGRRYFSVFYKRPDSLRQIYIARYSDIVKNKEYIVEFEKTAEALERLKPGNVAPKFNFPDINGKMVSSESLKGKVIYIDVWATWCAPCKDEIPYLKKLQKELAGEDVAFVSISTDDDKKAWEEMVKDKELGGYQLYSKGGLKSKIVEDYTIRGIPYFIIIDKEGKLVEVVATRPSNPETKEKLAKLAKS